VKRREFISLLGGAAVFLRSASRPPSPGTRRNIWTRCSQIRSWPSGSNLARRAHGHRPIWIAQRGV